MKSSRRLTEVPDSEEEPLTSSPSAQALADVEHKLCDALPGGPIQEAQLAQALDDGGAHVETSRANDLGLDPDGENVHDGMAFCASLNSEIPASPTANRIVLPAHCRRPTGLDEDATSQTNAESVQDILGPGKTQAQLSKAFPAELNLLAQSSQRKVNETSNIEVGEDGISNQKSTVPSPHGTVLKSINLFERGDDAAIESTMRQSLSKTSSTGQTSIRLDEAERTRNTTSCSQHRNEGDVEGYHDNLLACCSTTDFCSHHPNLITTVIDSSENPIEEVRGQSEISQTATERSHHVIGTSGNIMHKNTMGSELATGTRFPHTTATQAEHTDLSVLVSHEIVEADQVTKCDVLSPKPASSIRPKMNTSHGTIHNNEEIVNSSYFKSYSPSNELTVIERVNEVESHNNVSMTASAYSSNAAQISLVTIPDKTDNREAHPSLTAEQFASRSKASFVDISTSDQTEVTNHVDKGDRHTDVSKKIQLDETKIESYASSVVITKNGFPRSEERISSSLGTATAPIEFLTSDTTSDVTPRASTTPTIIPSIPTVNNVQPGAQLPLQVTPTLFPQPTRQEATLASLTIQKSALIVRLATLPAIQVLIEEAATRSSELIKESNNGDLPTEADILAAAQTLVKEHISLLHEYNEIKDVGQGLMGFIAEQRGVRVVDVMEEFGVEGAD